jgi:hypothetical protein
MVVLSDDGVGAAKVSADVRMSPTDGPIPEMHRRVLEQSCVDENGSHWNIQSIRRLTKSKAFRSLDSEIRVEQKSTQQ